MRYIIDSSVLFSGKDIPMDMEYYVPLSVVDEIKNKKIKQRLKYLFDCGLKIVIPKDIFTKKIIDVSKTTGDITKLSKTDIDILSLALEMNAVILTDDYAIQNVAKVLDIKYHPISTEGISKIFRWKWCCIGCKKYYDEFYRFCPVCGFNLKPKRVKD